MAGSKKSCRLYRRMNTPHECSVSLFPMHASMLWTWLAGLATRSVSCADLS